MLDGTLVLEGITPVVILAYTIYAIKTRVDGRIPIGIALGLLVVSAVILAFGKEDLANNVAIVCYYFLVCGVAVQFVEYLGERKG